jgi:hypothetical protein
VRYNYKRDQEGDVKRLYKSYPERREELSRKRRESQERGKE